MKKRTKGESPPVVISGWLRFQRTVLHRPEQGGISPPVPKKEERPAVPQTLPSPTATVPKTSRPSRPPLPPGPYRLTTGNIGQTITQILGAYRHFGSWRMVAHRFDVTLADFRTWVSTHQADFVGHSADLTTLLKPKAVPRRPRKMSEPPSGIADSPVPSKRTAVIGALKVGSDVKDLVDAYCQSHRLTYEQLFHRVFGYSKLADEAAVVGIADGVFEILVNEHRGLIIGSDDFQAVEAYCRQKGTTMEELFGGHDTGRTAIMAHEVGIYPTTFMHLVKFFKGSLAPVGAST